MSSVNNLKIVWVRQKLKRLRSPARSAIQQRRNLGTKTKKMQTNRNTGKLEHYVASIERHNY